MNEDKIIDMHMHSIASDGTFTPSELVEDAKKRGLEKIALTDHDTIDGLLEAMSKGEEIGVEVIPGIEFSTEYEGKEVHILGYMFDVNNKGLIKRLEELKEDRKVRTKLILEKLAKRKLYITMEELMEEVEGNIISRSHIANAMMKKGYVYSKSEAFHVYLRPNGAAYVPKQNLSPFDAIRLIKESGGIVSLAHPILMGFGPEKFEKFLDMLLDEGLDAIEVYYPNMDDKDTNYYKKQCIKRNLLYTGGSDFHGLNRPGSFIGRCGINEEEYKKLLEKWNKSNEKKV